MDGRGRSRAPTSIYRQTVKPALELDERFAGQLIQVALDCTAREYPNHLSHFLDTPDDVLSPKRLHPAFFGCLDWHSAVHNHWLLARLSQQFPNAAFKPLALQRLSEHLTADAIAKEAEYLRAPGRSRFECPYGWGWLATLDLALDSIDECRGVLSPLMSIIVQRLEEWLGDMPYPVRSGEHTNSAFGLGLLVDWAQRRTDHHTLELLSNAAQRLFSADADAAAHFEPSGHDFLSPSLSEADLMSRILSRSNFAHWLDRFFPNLSRLRKILTPVNVPTSKDYKLVHLHGLNISRAWMLATIAAKLSDSHRLRPLMMASAWAHRGRGLEAALRTDYGSCHWLPTFAAYCCIQPSWSQIH